MHSPRHPWRTIAREWLISLLAYSLLIAPFGCQYELALTGIDGLSDIIGDTTTLDSTSPGLFINSDSASDLIVAGRSQAGDAFFVFGNRPAGGSIEQTDVQSILLKTAAGEESYIIFESGRPVHLQGPDGSYLHIEYTSITPEELTGSVTVYDANTQKSETTSATIDLAQVQADLLAAAGVGADTIEQLTNRTVEIPESPDTSTGKLYHRSLSGILVTFAAIPLVILGQYLVAVMAQVMQAVFAAVTIAIQTAVVAAMTPMFLFTGLLGDTFVRIETLPLGLIFPTIPIAPKISFGIP